MDFKTPGGKSCVSIDDVEGITHIIKTKEKINEIVTRYAIDFKALDELENYIKKHSPEMYAKAENSLKPKKAKMK